MRRFLIRRFFYALLVLLGTWTATYFLTVLLPGDYVRAALSGGRTTPAFAESLRHIYGLDRPPWLQFLTWLSGAFRFDFGLSFSKGVPVLAVIAAYLPVTLLLGFGSFALELLFGIGMGMWGAYRQRRAADRLFVAFSLVTASLPPFLLALLLQKWLVIDLRLFPLSGIATAGAAFSLSDRIRHLALPCLTLALLESGRLSRYVRASAAVVLRQDAILAAKAGGLSPARIFFSFTLRGTLIPLITYFGLSLPVLFGGAIVMETLFGLPGLGLLAYEAVMARDYPLLLGLTTLVCVMTVAGNLLSDILYTICDPRIRSGGKPL